MKPGVGPGSQFELHRKEFSYLHFDDAKWELVKQGSIDSLLKEYQLPLLRIAILVIAICEGHYQYYSTLGLDKGILVLETAVKLNKKSVVEHILTLLPSQFGEGERHKSLLFLHAFQNQFWEIAEIFLKRFGKEINAADKKMAFEESLRSENYDFIMVMAATNTLHERSYEFALEALNCTVQQRLNLEGNQNEADKDNIAKLKEKEDTLFRVVHLCLKTTITGNVLKTALRYNYLFVVDSFLPGNADKLSVEDRKIIYSMAVIKGAEWKKVSEFLMRNFGAEILRTDPFIRFRAQEKPLATASTVEPPKATKAQLSSKP